MKSSEKDPFDALLDQSLQSASTCLDGEKFRNQLAGRIAEEQCRMNLLRLLPAGMGVLAAIVASLSVLPKFDVRTGLSTLATLSDTLRPVPEWLIHSLPGAPNSIFVWAALAGVALLLSLWFTSRETDLFQL